MNNKFVVIDLETSGLSKSDYIIEVGAVKIENGKLTERFSSFVSCPQQLSPETTYLTGITNDQLIGEPSVEEVLKKLHSFSKGCILVAHNMSFQYSFLSKYGEEYGIFFDNPMIDTLTIAKARLNGRVKNYHLGTIAEYLCIETGNLYHSIDYAILAAKMFLELEKM